MIFTCSCQCSWPHWYKCENSALLQALQAGEPKKEKHWKNTVKNSKQTAKQNAKKTAKKRNSKNNGKSECVKNSKKMRTNSTGADPVCGYKHLIKVPLQIQGSAYFWECPSLCPRMAKHRLWQAKAKCDRCWKMELLCKLTDNITGKVHTPWPVWVISKPALCKNACFPVVLHRPIATSDD